MKNIIFGTGQFARETAKIFESFGITIDAFINNKSHLPNTVYSNKPVFNVSDIDFEQLQPNIFIAKRPMFIGSAIELLMNKETKGVSLVREEMFFEHIYNLDDLQKFIYPIDYTGKPILNYLETNIVDHCNLNCKGCAHFANICNPHYVDFNQFQKDLCLLSEKFDLINFRLLGGEPLLHPDIKEILNTTRELLPTTEIMLVTNGLLIPKLGEDILQAIVDNDIIVSITLYEPTFDSISLILKQLDRFCIKYCINDDYFNQTDIVKTFHTRLSLNKSQEGFEANKNCGGRFCRFLRDGKISKCYYPLLIDILNEKFDLNFEVDDLDYFNLIDIDDGWETIFQMNGDIPFCLYCRNEQYNFDWKRASKNVAKADDYVLKLKR